MEKIVVKKETNYTVISNVFLRDERMSLKCKGLLAYLLSLPNDWKLYVTELKERHRDGITAIYSALKELEELGYLKRERIRKLGRIQGIEYLISETPNLENLNVENQALLNIDSNKVNTLQTNYIIDWKNIADEINFNDIDNFIDYWTEKSPRGRKMRFEKQKTFDVKRRMQRWMRNNFNKPKVSQTDHMFNVWQEAKKIING